MMQWRRLTPRSFADAIAVLGKRRWWLGRSNRGGNKAASAAAPPVARGGGRPSRLVRLRRPF